MRVSARLVDLSNPNTNRNAQNEVKEARGFYFYALKKWYRPRTLKQNRYWWAICIPYLADFLAEGTGESWTEDETHTFAKRFWLPPVVKMMPDGGEYRTEPSTTTLTSKEFATLVDCCTLWLGEQGVDVPPPSAFEKG